MVEAGSILECIWAWGGGQPGLLGLPLTSLDGHASIAVLLMGRLLDAGSRSCLDGSTSGDVAGRSVSSSLSSRSASE